MAYRFTDTDKWRDAWFTNLSQIEMLLFLYLCDNCNIAGIAEVNYRLWAFELRSTESTIKGALKGLERSVLVSDCEGYIYLKNFIKHQKNLPLNEENKAHLGIIRRLTEILPKFVGYSQPIDINLINTFVQSPYKAPSKGLQRGTGIGIGNSISNKEGDSMKEGEESESPKEENEYERVTESFNLICTSLPKVRTISNKRKRHIKARLKDFGGDMNLLEDVFRQVEASDYLSGRSGVWRASFDWIMGSQDNLVKIMEGNYDNKKRTGQNAITDEQLASAIRSGLERGKRMYGEQ